MFIKKTYFRKSISLLFFACAIPLVIFILPIIGYENIVYKLDNYSPFWIFSLQLGLGLLLFIKLFKDFYQWLKNLLLNPYSLFPPLLIATFALATSIAFIEPRSRVQSDEAIHYVVAQNLYYNQIGMFCNEGSFMENDFACVMYNTIKAKGLSYIYMLGMPFFGKHLYWVHTLHLFFLALALLSFYLALLAWFGKNSLPLLATALLASCPMLLFAFRSASVEPLYVTLFCVSLLLLKWVYDGNTTRHWILMALVLAFFAQTRTETVFCLLAFIGVAAFRMSKAHTPYPIPHTLFFNSPFSIFLATLSFFSLPVLCTLSNMRNSDLQGGNLGAFGHLFSNIVSNFKVMALPNSSNDGTLVYPFLPYFTWLCFLGILTLIILTIKELRSKKNPIPHTPYPIPYKYITAFLLLLSPQYLLLFNGVSADLTMTVQWRFALVILPPMAFLGAFFLYKLSNILNSQFSILNSKLRPNIALYGTAIIILTTCLVQYKTFIKDPPNERNFVTTEDYELHKWIKQKPPERMLFFSWHTALGLAHGYSAYTYLTLLDLNSDDLKDILEDYKGEVYFINTSSCDIMIGSPKMRVPNTFRVCDRAIRYFNTQEVFSKEVLGNFNLFSIHKILGFNDIDSLGLLRILNKIEPTDSTVELHFKVPKELNEPWKLQRFINDSLIQESLYKKSYYTDTYNLSIFNRDTNIWRLDIVDTLADTLVHSDFWELVRVKQF